MLPEVLFAAAPTTRVSRPDRVPGLSISQLFPCPYRLYRVHKGELWGEEIEPRVWYNMDDGWDQEEQSVRRLAKAGIRIIDRQKHVHIGKSEIPGRMDGAFILNGKRRVWEHKAYGLARFELLTARGLGAHPDSKAQINGYMLGDGSDEGVFFVKVKDNNDYWDTLVELDRSFITEIVEWCDRIRLEGWEPEPAECRWCAYCGLDCFGAVLDFSWMKSVTAEEVAKKWLEGDKLEKVGSMLKGEARTYFVGEEGIIGDRDLLLVEDLLEIRKVVQHRFDISKQKVLGEFGPEGLMKVGEEKEVVQYRFKGV